MTWVRLKIFSGYRSHCYGFYLWTSSGVTTDGEEGVFCDTSGTISLKQSKFSRSGILLLCIGPQ